MWNSEAITSLLEKVRQENVLWNIKHPYYHKKTLKRTLFDKICVELKTEYPQLEITTVEVMDKFKYLRGQYQKCLRKIRNAPSGSAATTPIKWEHYKTCSFMQSAYDLGPTESSFIHPDDLEPQQKQEVLYEGPIEDLENYDISVSPTSIPSNPTPSPLPDINEEIIREIPDQPNTSYKKNSQVVKKKRKMNKSDAVEEGMLKTIDNLQAVCAEQAMKNTRHDMVTESVMAAMKFFSSYEEVKMDFTVQVMELIAAKTRECQAIEKKRQGNN
ncbi:uncharacterized protein LOC119570425 [Penaeus monodon]|uniref:uncharacterized protein LOC119570425 n=1 Tax=Penaeus monodon TaxID=6687 RepID=UPI0018A76EB8|nr:uncharacterized protein LOC119570425 [Penaeus monodon]